MFLTSKQSPRHYYYNPYAHLQRFSLPCPPYTNSFKTGLPKPNPILEMSRFAHGPNPPLIPIKTCSPSPRKRAGIHQACFANPPLALDDDVPPYSPFPPPPKNFGRAVDEKPLFANSPHMPDNPTSPYSPFPPPRKNIGCIVNDQPLFGKPPPIPASPINPAFPSPFIANNPDGKPKPFTSFPDPVPKHTKCTPLFRPRSFRIRPPGRYGRIRAYSASRATPSTTRRSRSA